MTQHMQLLRLLMIHKIDVSLSLVLAVLQADVVPSLEVYQPLKMTTREQR